MKFEINPHLAQRFEAAIAISKEDPQTVIDRMFKSYIYNVFSRSEESWEGLEPFLTLPKPKGGQAHEIRREES